MELTAQFLNGKTHECAFREAMCMLSMYKRSRSAHLTPSTTIGCHQLRSLISNGVTGLSVAVERLIDTVLGLYGTSDYLTLYMHIICCRYNVHQMYTTLFSPVIIGSSEISLPRLFRLLKKEIGKVVR